MAGGSTDPDRLAPEARAFYRRTLEVLNGSGIPYLVGGAYALARFAGIERHTKDFDIFLKPGDCPRALEALAAVGCRTELTFPHWLGKAHSPDGAFDLIYSSGNGLADVDDAWFAHAVADAILDVSVRLVPPEEMIWQKAFVMERERFDGADVAHLIRARGAGLDWDRLLRRFAGPHGRVLLAHLVLFDYIYPSERGAIPGRVLEALARRVRDEQAAPPPADRLCRGPFLSRAQYLPDLERWGYRDARLAPQGPMSADEIALWTDAIGKP